MTEAWVFLQVVGCRREVQSDEANPTTLADRRPALRTLYIWLLRLQKAFI